MALEAGSVIATFKSNIDGMLSGIDKVKDSTERLKNGFSSTSTALYKGGKYIATGIGIATAAVATMGVKSTVIFANFEKAMSSVFAKTGEESEEMRQKLTQLARDLGASTIYSATEVANAMDFLAMAGFNSNEILQTTNDMLNLAAAGNLDLARAADIASNVLTGFSMEANEAGRAADVIAKTATSSNTSVEQLGEAMKYLAPTAASLGMNIEQTAAVIATLGDAGIQGSLAGRALGTSLVRLAKPTDSMVTAMKKMNLEAFDAKGNFVGMAGLIRQIEEGTKDYTQEQLQGALATIFGAEALQEMNILLNKTADGYEDTTNMLTESTGAAQKMADTMTDNVWGSFKAIVSALQEVMIKIGETLSETFDFQGAILKLAQYIRDNKDAIGDFVKNGLDKMISILKKVKGFLQPVIDLLAKFFSNVENKKALVVGILALLSAGLIAFVAGLIIANATIILIFTAIGATAAALYKMWKQTAESIQRITDWLISAWGRIKEMYETTKGVFNAIGDEFKRLYKEYVKPIIDQVKSVFKAFGDFFTWVWDNLVFPYLYLAYAIFANIFDKIVTVFSKAWSKIKEVFGPVVEWLKSKSNESAKSMSSAFEWLSQKVSSIWGKIKEYIINPIQDAYGKVINFADKITDGIIKRLKDTFSWISGKASEWSDTLAKPFKWAKEKIENIAKEIKEVASKIDPNKRESPSLVDRVKSGVSKIKSEYSNLGQAIQDMNLRAGGSLSVDGETQSVQNNNSQIYNQQNTFNVNDGLDLENLTAKLAYQLRTAR